MYVHLSASRKTHNQRLLAGSRKRFCELCHHRWTGTPPSWASRILYLAILSTVPTALTLSIYCSVETARAFEFRLPTLEEMETEEDREAAAEKTHKRPALAREASNEERGPEVPKTLQEYVKIRLKKPLAPQGSLLPQGGGMSSADSIRALLSKLPAGAARFFDPVSGKINLPPGVKSVPSDPEQALTDAKSMAKEDLWKKYGTHFASKEDAAALYEENKASLNE